MSEPLTTDQRIAQLETKVDELTSLTYQLVQADKESKRVMAIIAAAMESRYGSIVDQLALLVDNLETLDPAVAKIFKKAFTRASFLCDQGSAVFNEISEGLRPGDEPPAA